MALPTSGNLSIKAEAGTSRSISLEVDGSITGDKSLNTLGITAGFSGGGTSMREFYGYSFIPDPPSNVTAEQLIVDKRIFNTTWVDNSSNEDGFEVQFQLGTDLSTATWVDVTITAQNVTSASYDNDLVTLSGLDYRFRVRSFKVRGAGTFSSPWTLSPIGVTT